MIFNCTNPVLLVLGSDKWVSEKIVMLYRVHLAWAEFELTTLVVIGTRMEN